MLPKLLTVPQVQQLAIILIGICLTAISCSWTPQVTTPLYEGREGSVSFITESHSNFHPSHPSELSAQTILQVLGGLYIQKDTGILQGLLSGEPAKKPVFSVGQITWLTPILQQAFSQVTKEEKVRFQVNNSPSSDLSTIKGTMFVDGNSLVVSLDWRSRGAGTSSKQIKRSSSRNPTGTLAERLRFTPEHAVKKNLSDSWLRGSGNQNRVVIDKLILASDQPQPEESLTPVEQQKHSVFSDSNASKPTTAEPRALSDQTHTISPTQPAGQDLLEEIKALKQKLDAQQAEIDALKNR